ncbi:MAG TPA: YicC/YloC family endoribonuclease, partial [Pyrinomonadaceae bacterium]|nr:YicC/YloC family endoribonuclease [Pyrinomonadaceae bacterium]
MKSMTGFGRGTVTGEAFKVVVEVKTVNNRYLDVHLRLNQELSSLEMNVRKLISSRLSRGRVDVNINFERSAATTYEINRTLIAGYINALRDIQQEFSLAGDVDINTLTRLPGAMTTARDGLDEASVAGIERAMMEALDDLARMRENEGAALAEEMRMRVTKIEAQVPV